MQLFLQKRQKLSSALHQVQIHTFRQTEQRNDSSFLPEFRNLCWRLATPFLHLRPEPGGHIFLLLHIK